MILSLEARAHFPHEKPVPSRDWASESGLAPLWRSAAHGRIDAVSPVADSAQLRPPPSVPTSDFSTSGVIERNAHQLLVTTRTFLDYAGLRDLADLPSPGEVDSTGDHAGGWSTHQRRRQRERMMNYSRQGHASKIRTTGVDEIGVARRHAHHAGGGIGHANPGSARAR